MLWLSSGATYFASSCKGKTEASWTEYFSGLFLMLMPDWSVEKLQSKSTDPPLERAEQILMHLLQRDSVGRLVDDSLGSTWLNSVSDADRQSADVVGHYPVRRVHPALVCCPRPATISPHLRSLRTDTSSWQRTHPHDNDISPWQPIHHPGNRHIVMTTVASLQQLTHRHDDVHIIKTLVTSSCQPTDHHENRYITLATDTLSWPKTHRQDNRHIVITMHISRQQIHNPDNSQTRSQHREWNHFIMGSSPMWEFSLCNCWKWTFSWVTTWRNHWKDLCSPSVGCYFLCHSLYATNTHFTLAAAALCI